MKRNPQGAPFWKYKPKTHIIDPEPRVVTMRDYIPNHDERMPNLPTCSVK